MPMVKVKIGKENSKNIYQIHNIRLRIPSSNSYAASLLMREQLRIEDKKLASKFRIWLSFRKHVFKEWRKEKKPMVCYWCEKRNLKLGMIDKSNPMAATIEHLQPRGKGGEEFDIKNLEIACVTCNNARGDNLNWAVKQ